MMVDMDQTTKDELSPGIRDLVIKLDELGYTTTDSGDGSNHEDGMECALPYRHVFGTTPTSDIITFAKALQAHFPKARVEITYVPGEPVIWMLFPDGIPEE